MSRILQNLKNMIICCFPFPRQYYPTNFIQYTIFLNVSLMFVDCVLGKLCKFQLLLYIKSIILAHFFKLIMNLGAQAIIQQKRKINSERTIRPTR